MLSIVTPIKEAVISKDFIERNKQAFQEHKLIVINSSGGEPLKSYCWKYIEKHLNMWEARKLGYEHVETPLVLNLDSDIIIPKNYVEDAIDLLRQKDIGAVSIFFKNITKHRGILEFGISMWKTTLLIRLYDFSYDKTLVNPDNKICECLYMWHKLLKSGYQLETLPYRAEHLKGKN